MVRCRLLSIILLVVTAATAGCLQEHISGLVAGRPEDALAERTKAIQNHPSDPEAYITRANLNCKQKAYHEAVADCNDAIGLDATRSEAYATRAGAYNALGVKNKAFADRVRALAIDPANSSARLCRAVHYMSYHETAKALDDLDQVIARDPHDVNALCLRCSIYAMRREFPQARADLAAYAHRHPFSSQTQMLHAMLDLEQERIGPFLGRLLLAGLLHPFQLRVWDSPDGRGKTFTFDTRGDKPFADQKLLTEKRIADASARLARNPRDIAALYERAAASMRAQNYRQAVDDLSQVIALDPNDAEAYRERAAASSRLQSCDSTSADFSAHLQACAAALADCQKVIELDPNNAENFMQRAYVYVRLPADEQALADCEKASRLDPKLAYPWRCRASIHDRQRDYSKAVDDYTAILRVVPDESGAYRHRAHAYLGLKKYAEAFADFKRTSGLGGSRIDFSPYACEQMAWDLASSPDPAVRNGPEAVKYATKACEGSKWESPTELEALAAAYAECGRFDEALKWQHRALEKAYGDEEKKRFEERLKLYQSGRPYRQKA